MFPRMLVSARLTHGIIWWFLGAFRFFDCCACFSVFSADDCRIKMLNIYLNFLFHRSMKEEISGLLLVFFFIVHKHIHIEKIFFFLFLFDGKPVKKHTFLFFHGKTFSDKKITKRENISHSKTFYFLLLSSKLVFIFFFPILLWVRHYEPNCAEPKIILIHEFGFIWVCVSDRYIRVKRTTTKTTIETTKEMKRKNNKTKNKTGFLKSWRRRSGRRIP